MIHLYTTKEGVVMSKILYLLCFCSLLYAGDGKVSIHSLSLDASVYVDGEKVGVVSKKPLLLALAEGKHEIMVSNILDEDWQEVQRKKIMLKKDDMLKLSFSLNLEKISKKTNKTSADNFEKKGDVVLDKAAKLVWQDDKTVIEVKKNWFDADTYCTLLNLDGQKGWRVPSYDELISIVDYTKHTLAAMPAFKHVISESYWSSTVDEKDKNKAKNVYFGNGCPNANLKENKYHIRCVHSR